MRKQQVKSEVRDVLRRRTRNALGHARRRKGYCRRARNIIADVLRESRKKYGRVANWVYPPRRT